MSGSTASRAVVACVAFVAVGAACSVEPLPPFGEAIVVVDTDLPVPQLASRLRVDLYSPEGKWYASRDIGRPNPGDWPVSFSLYSTDEQHEKVALLRLRAYAEGYVRDYRGERPPEERRPYEEPFVARSMADLCSDPPKLELGKTITLRRGLEPFIGRLTGGDCENWDSVVGSVAAVVDIPEEGEYRFAVLRTFPPHGLPPSHQVTLQLRAECESDASAIFCQAGIDAAAGRDDLPDVTVSLKPGRYTLVTSGAVKDSAPTDITLAAARASEWDALETGVEAGEPVPDQPLTLEDSANATPAFEPIPTLAVDRLVLVRLEPGVRGALRVTLRGACAGTAAKLRRDPFAQRPVLEEAETCVDTEGGMSLGTLDEPISVALGRPPAGNVGSWPYAKRAPCVGEAGPEEACIPGGAGTPTKY